MIMMLIMMSLAKRASFVFERFIAETIKQINSLFSVSRKSGISQETHLGVKQRNNKLNPNLESRI